MDLVSGAHAPPTSAPSAVVSQVGSSSQVLGPSSEGEAHAEIVADSDSDRIIDLEEDSD